MQTIKMDLSCSPYVFVHVCIHVHTYECVFNNSNKEREAINLKVSGRAQEKLEEGDVGEAEVRKGKGEMMELNFN